MAATFYTVTLQFTDPEDTNLYNILKVRLFIRLFFYLLQLERHCDLLRTIAVLNTVPVSNINIKEIIGNYECSSLAKSLFHASGLLNDGGNGKSDLVHAVCLAK